MKTQRKWLMALAACSLGVFSSAQTNYDFSKLQREKLGRGVVAVRENTQKVAVSWRYLSSDPMETAFNVYRNGKKIAQVPAGTGTFYTDNYSGNQKVVYTVKPVVNGKETSNEGSYTLPGNAPSGYIDIPLDKPTDGVTPAGEKYSYSPNDASIGDVDGDGNYEIILKCTRQCTRWLHRKRILRLLPPDRRKTMAHRYGKEYTCRRSLHSIHGI